MPDYEAMLRESLGPRSEASDLERMLTNASTAAEPRYAPQTGSPPREADLKIGQYHRAYSEDAEKRWGPGSLDYAVDRIPVAGTALAIDDVARLREAAQAHQAGKATDEQLAVIGHHLAKSEYEGKRTGTGQRALDLSTHLPGLVAEWAATGGAGGAGRIAATKLATRMGLKAAGGIGARAFARGAIGAIGEGAARTALMPSTLNAMAANTVGQDEQGNIVPKNIGTAALKGAASSLVMNTLFSATGQWGLDRPVATTAMGFAKEAAGGLGKAMGAMHGGQELNYLIGAADTPDAIHEYLAKGSPEARNSLLAEIAVFGTMEAFLHAKATIKARAEKMRAVGLDPTAPANQAKIAAEIEPLVKNPEAAKEAQPATEPYIDLNKTEPHIQLPEEKTVRMYHGGEEGIAGAKWFSPDEAYASGYAKKDGRNAPVAYVDLPESSPHLKKVFDDTGTDQKSPYMSVELPEEIARHRKIMPEPAPQAGTPPPEAPVAEAVPEKTGPFEHLDREEVTSLAKNLGVKTTTPEGLAKALKSRGMGDRGIDALSEETKPKAAPEPPPAPAEVQPPAAPPEAPQAPAVAPAKPSMMDRMLAKGRAAEGKAVAPPMAPLDVNRPNLVKPEEPAGMAALRQRFETGEKVELEDVFKASGLTAQEQKAVQERLQGNSFAEVGKAMGVSRQRIQQIEKAADAKLGANKSIAELVHKQEQHDRALDMIAKGETVKASELHHDPELVDKAHQQMGAEDAQDAIKERFANLILEEHDHGTLSPERLAALREGLLRELEKSSGRASPASGEAPGIRGEGTGTPGQRRPAEPLPPAGAATQPGAGVEPRLPEGMGAAGGGSQAGAPEPGTPGAKGGFEEPPETAATVKATKSGLLRRSLDFLHSFANQAFPALTRLSENAGAKLASAANADKAVKSTWDYMSRVIKVNGTPLAEMTPEQNHFIGSVWLERRMREYRDRLNREGKVSGNVRTLVGQEGSPLATEADYQEGLRSLWPFFEAIKQEWTPVVDKNFKGIVGLEPDDAIDAKSQIPGLPLNAIALAAEDLGKPGVVGMGKKQGFENLRIKNPGFTRTAELNAEAYDTDISHMMQRTLKTGIPAARRAEFVRTALADGVLKDVRGAEKPPDGFQALGLDPARKLAGIDANARYYVHPDAFRDVVQGLGIGERPGQAIADVLQKITQPIYNVALAAPVELATHIANHFTALFKDGMGIPILNLKDSFTNAWKLWKKDPEILRKVMNLANLGASFGHEAKPGLLESVLGKETADKYFDPTRWLNNFTAGFIDTMQKAVRVQLDAAYDKVTTSKGMQPTDTGRRDFVNQALGNYSNHANNRLTQFLKDSGIQAFATAAHTFTAQGVKAATLQGNLRGQPLESMAGLMAIRALKLMPFLAMGPVINYLRWGQAFPDDVPDFAIKTSEEGTKVNNFDPLAFTGVRRGAKMIGMNAVVENAIHGDKTGGQMIDKAFRDSMLSLTHLAEGPPVQFAHTAITGEGFGGRKVAEQVSKATTPQGIAKAKSLGKPEPGSSQMAQNLTAAALGVNPVVASFTEADRPKTPRTFLENVTRSFGPFGVKEREKKMTPAERRRMGLR